MFRENFLQIKKIFKNCELYLKSFLLKKNSPLSNLDLSKKNWRIKRVSNYFSVTQKLFLFLLCSDSFNYFIYETLRLFTFFLLFAS